MPYAKKTGKNTARKPLDYAKFIKDLDRVVEVEDGEMGLQTGKNTARKPRDYVKFKDLDRVVEVEDGEMWLQNGKYSQPGISIAFDDEHTLSDWTRKIKLQNVCLDVVENDKGYPELVISGMTADLPF